MTDWAAGMKAVCIADNWVYCHCGGPCRCGGPHPAKGEVFEVVATHMVRTAATDVLFLCLKEFDLRWGFRADNFRPLTEPKADISIFEKMLGPSHAPAAPELVE